MIGAIVRAVLVAVIATVTLVGVVQLAPTQRPLAVAVYLLVMGGLTAHLLVGWLRLTYPPPPASPFDTALAARPVPPRPPAELDRLARLLALSSASALHAHTRLRSELRPVAADRLRWSLAVDLDGEPDAARAAARRGRMGAARPRPARPARPGGGRPVPGGPGRADRQPGTDRRTGGAPRWRMMADGGLGELRRLAGRVLDEVERAVVGKRDALELVLLGLLADGHVLLDDYPGLAKTLIARSFARVTSLRFARVQFTPDLMPSDVTGSSIYNQRLGDFEFRPGPVFTNLLLGDEINRSPPKTQAALLEAMQERQVTIDGVTRPLERPFLVVATQNPIEFEGTYPLPEAQLDRFLMRLSVGYPSADAEWQMLERRLERTVDEVELDQVATPADVLAMQRAVEEVHVAESVGRYIVELVSATRASPRVQVGSSPRGSLALLKVARARAALAGRDFVTPEDVKAVAVPTLAHRLLLRPELWVRRVRTEDVVAELLEQVPTPPPEAEPAAVRSRQGG